MFEIEIINGYRVGHDEKDATFIETERFSLSFNDADPKVSDVLQSIRYYFSERQVYSGYLERYLFLTDFDRSISITEDPFKRLSDFGVTSGCKLYVSSTMR